MLFRFIASSGGIFLLILLKAFICKLLKFLHDQLLEQLIARLRLRVDHSYLFTNANGACGGSHVLRLIKGTATAEKTL